jgi:hypothetical protein
MNCGALFARHGAVAFDLGLKRSLRCHAAKLTPAEKLLKSGIELHLP